MQRMLLGLLDKERPFGGITRGFCDISLRLLRCVYGFGVGASSLYS